MKLADFNYSLPPGLIAQFPLENRTDSRLLCLDGHTGQINDKQFRDITGLLKPGDLLVFNNTRVIPARLHGHKASGGKVEVLVERCLDETTALAHVRASKAPRPGTTLLVGGNVLHVIDRQDDLFVLQAEGCSLEQLLDAEGHMPLPPYIQRDDTEFDQARYQTVYAARPGAVAAPTAGLHFDEKLLKTLTASGIEFGYVTLHVGAGTFQPVRTSNLDDHIMHSEYLEVDEVLCTQVAEARRRGGRVVAVGTTSVRCLESASADGELKPFKGDTRLFIRPGYCFKSVDALITNFHLPESTLLMLISAFGGYDEIKVAYRHAVEQKYRFFSYGDAMWLTHKEK